MVTPFSIIFLSLELHSNTIYLKALVIDDEPMPAKYLVDLIQEHCIEISSVHVIHSPTEALEHLKTKRYDLLFLDVEMPEMDGFEFLEKVRLPESTQVIFTTAFSQYAIKAFQSNAVHYLLKIIDKDDLINAVQRAAKMIRNVLAPSQPLEYNGQQIIPIFHNDEYHLIREHEIIRLETSGSYTQIVLANNQLLSSKRIGFYENKLSDRLFFRCHNSHMVNLSKIIRFGKQQGNYVTLINEQVVPVAGSKREALENILSLNH